MLTMKSQRIAMKSTTRTSLPSTPPPPSTPQALKVINSISNSKKIRRPIFNLTDSTTPISPIPSKIPQKWIPLNLPKTELSLPLTFPTGQTFTWKQTAPLQFTGVVSSYLFSLKHLDEDDGQIAYCLHRTADGDDPNVNDAALSALLDFLNAGISLSHMWNQFSLSDSRFAQLAQCLGGARVLRQDPLECLIQFLCSSNNNIKRITKMVDFVSSLGNYVGNVEGINFFEFPSLERLASISEKEFRDAGFGYRAKYIVGTVNALQSKPVNGREWLISLRKSDLQEVTEALCTLPGVGPKVAACIALFSLDQHHAIPVDTHVWKIATAHLIPELAGAALTPKLHSRVADAFVSKYGKYAGWAQTLLFIADLPSQKLILLSNIPSSKDGKLYEEKEAQPGDMHQTDYK